MKKIVMAMILALPSTVFAVPSETGKITFIQIHQNHDTGSARYLIKLDSTISENNCTNDSWTGYFENNIDQAMYSTLLAMYLSGKEVKLQGKDADSCVGHDMLIRNVYPEW